MTTERYRIERRIGQGAMASVLLARDVILDRPVALKLLADNLAADDVARGRFVNEARLAARLAHDNVVRVFDAGDDGGRPYIVMEYVPGETLASVAARSGRCPVDDVVQIGLELSAALAHAHALGVVHRDVKPHNVLVRPDGRVKLTDFGIAKAGQDRSFTQAGTVIGTAAYMAPEQAAGATVGPAADIYALGAVLYELLAGRPFGHTTVEMTQFGPTMAGIPSPLAGLLGQCLSADPTRRPSAAELHQRLVELSPEQPEAPTVTPPAAPTVTRPVSAPTTVLPPSQESEREQRQPLTHFAPKAAAILFGILLLVVLLLSRNGSPPAPGTDPLGSGEAPTATSASGAVSGETTAADARKLASWLRTFTD